MSRATTSLPAMLLTLLVAAAASASDIKVFKGRITLPIGGESPSVYFVLRNGSAETRTITGASCECAESMSVRRTAVTEDGQWGCLKACRFPPAATLPSCRGGFFFG